MPVVSVVMPTYRHRDYVLESLESVFAQTFTDYEVIVVNDGSPDDTGELLRPLAEAGRIRYVEQANAGQSRARNRGIEEARGEYVALLDDDDVWPPDKLEWQVGLLAGHPDAVMVYGQSALCREETPGGGMREYARMPEDGGGAPSGRVWEQYVRRNYIQSPGQTLIRRDALRRVGGFDAALWGTDDWDLYIRLAKEGEVLYRERVALRYRFHPGNASRNIGRMQRNAAAVRRKHLGRFPTPRNGRLWWENRGYTGSIFGADYINATGEALLRGDKRTARRLWVRGVLARPAFLGMRHTYYLLRKIL